MEDPKIVELTEINICRICENRFAKYTCPKCNILYCSLACYQSEKHLECSETFYQKCVYDELKLGDDNPDSKAKMEEILRRFYEQQNQDEDMETLDSDDENELGLSERLANVDLNDADTIWELLTTDERQEFEALVNSGDVTKFVPIWTAWWEIKKENKLVQDIGISKETTSNNNFSNNCPQILANIKLFDDISKVEPACCVKYNLVNVISAYSSTMRYFNGDPFGFAKEAVYLITNLSKNLNSNENFESYSLALESVHQQILMNDWMKPDEDVKTRLYNDIKNIIQGPEKENKMFYIKCALSDIHKLFLLSKTFNVVKNDKNFTKRFQESVIPTDKVVSKNKLKMLIRKIEYYLSYVTNFVIHFE